MIKTKILVDEFSSEPTNNYEELSDTLSTIIKNSQPHFTIGIYGEWGTGKTTMMKLVEKKLSDGKERNKSKILPIWFNAWRYEREEQLATIAMMKTIAYAMADHKKFEPVSTIMKKGLFSFGKDMLRQLALQIMTEKGVEKFEDSFTEKAIFLNSIERDTIYFDGLRAISEQMKKIRHAKQNEGYRVVVFVDDLDRCSPKKALEVLESIKVFLDIEGFIYVLGISHKTIDRLITFAYNEVGVQGSDYIKKIIQIPIKLPLWENDDLTKLISEKLSVNLKPEYSKLLSKNAEIISKVAENNPRQLKRFINSLIIVYETYSSKDDKLELRKLFVSLLIKKQMPKFFVIYVNDKQLRKIINKFLKLMPLPRIITSILTNRDPVLRPPIIDHFPSVWELIKHLYLDIEENKKTKNDEEIKTIFRRAFSEITTKSDTSLKKPSRYYDELMKMSIEDWKMLHLYSNTIAEISNWKTYEDAVSIIDDVKIEDFDK